MGREYDGIHRKTFVIDENGVVAKVIDKVKTKDHAAQLLDQSSLPKVSPKKSLEISRLFFY